MSTTAQIKRVLTRDKGVCVIALPGCLKVATTADHRANRGSGGSKLLDAFPVLIAACILCNGAKEDAYGLILAELKRRGVRVEKDSTNAKTLARCLSIPVLYPDGVERFLSSDGRAVPVGEVPA